MVHIRLRWGTMVWSAGKRKKEDHGKNHLPHTQGEEISTKSIRLNFYLQNSWRKVIKYGKYPDDEGITVQSPLFILKYHFSWICIHFKTEHSKQRRLRIFTQLMPTKCLNVSLFCEMLKKIYRKYLVTNLCNRHSTGQAGRWNELFWENTCTSHCS